MRFSGWFGLIMGFLMIGMWTFFLLSGQVPELKTEPYRIAFHLAAEFSTAICLVIGGAGLLKKKLWSTSLYLAAAGMLLYSLIVSPGYYAQLGEWELVVMFAVLFLIALLSIRSILIFKHSS